MPKGKVKISGSTILEKLKKKQQTQQDNQAEVSLVMPVKPTRQNAQRPANTDQSTSTMQPPNALASSLPLSRFKNIANPVPEDAFVRDYITDSPHDLKSQFNSNGGNRTRVLRRKKTKKRNSTRRRRRHRHRRNSRKTFIS